MLEERRAVVGAVEAVHAFKLLAHHLHLCQHHMEHRRAQFKAISLCFFACAIIDYVRALSGDVAASAAGTYLLTIIEAFRLFDWRTLMVRVTMEGRTLIIKKQSSEVEVSIYLESQRGESTHNVTASNVKLCRDRLSEVLPLHELQPSDLSALLDAALDAQNVDARQEREATPGGV